MAISGLEKLVQYAQDLAVEPSRGPRRPERTEPAAPSRERKGDGIKLSLSRAATGPAPAEGPAEDAAETSSTPATYGPRENTTAASPITPRSGSAVAAYQRTGSAALGQRIAIRA